MECYKTWILYLILQSIYILEFPKRFHAISTKYKCFSKKRTEEEFSDFKSICVVLYCRSSHHLKNVNICNQIWIDFTLCYKVFHIFHTLRWVHFLFLCPLLFHFSWIFFLLIVSCQNRFEKCVVLNDMIYGDRMYPYSLINQQQLVHISFAWIKLHPISFF